MVPEKGLKNGISTFSEGKIEKSYEILLTQIAIVCIFMTAKKSVLRPNEKLKCL